MLYEVITISRSIVYGALAVLIGGVYVGLVVGLGTLIGSGDDRYAFVSNRKSGTVTVIDIQTQKKVKDLEIVITSYSIHYTKLYEGIVGQRMPTPPLDMLTEAGAAGAGYNPALAGGWDGGLPRHGLLGYVSGSLSADTQSRLDFRKVVEMAKPVFFPESYNFV